MNEKDDAKGSTEGEVRDEKLHSLKPKESKKKKSPSLIRSIHAIHYKRIWLAGLFKLLGDTLQTTSPLVNKALLNWLTVSFLVAKGGGAGQADSKCFVHRVFCFCADAMYEQPRSSPMINREGLDTDTGLRLHCLPCKINSNSSCPHISLY